MRVVSAAEVDGALSFPALIGALREAFAGDITVPVRHHHEIVRPGAATATHLLMPAWTGGDRTTDGAPGASGGSFLGTKIVNVFPDNAKRGLPSIFGTYLLMSGETGETLAAIDGTRLTAWRTAAASALAASFLARPDAAHMVMVGAGALAPFLVRAHAAVRPIRRVSLWNRDPARAAAVVPALAADGITATLVGDLEQAVREADIISCATLSREPLVKGAWLKPGAHLDLVGAYSPAMRESDDEAVRRARLFVDTRAGALKEGGDIVQPLAEGVIRKGDVEAELAELCRGMVTVERAADDITLFKSVGTAVEDLAAAMLVWKTLGQPSHA
jgi:ornithine cyclodeaminase/alanine dehydrogenase-like protein (mu-crystallin family)